MLKGSKAQIHNTGTPTHSSSRPKATMKTTRPRLRKILRLTRDDRRKQRTAKDLDPKVSQHGWMNESRRDICRDQRRNATDKLHYIKYALEYSGNHVLVNQARTLSGVSPLTRSIEMDDMARIHASEMAINASVYPSCSTRVQLQAKLRSKSVGENVQCGLSIRKMHRETGDAEHCQKRTNILSKEFTEFGVGTAKGDDGLLYMVQFFRCSDASFDSSGWIAMARSAVFFLNKFFFDEK